MAKLTVAGVRNSKPGRYADGDGLYLIVKPTGGRSWLLRVQVDGRRRDIGLGSVELITRPGADIIEIPLLHRKRLSLGEARDKCAVLRKAALAGLDPVVERDRDRRGIPTFEQAAEACNIALKGNRAPEQQVAFLSALRRHAFPVIGAHRVHHITASDIQDVLAPIWTKTPDMARKVRHWIAQVLNFSHAKGWRPTEAPGKSVSMGLSKSAPTGNYAAMPYEAVPAFVADVNGKPETIGRLALLFTIYTAARSGETRNARWSHFDLDAKLWNRPAALMKMRMVHAVTLNADAIAILNRVARWRSGLKDDLVFPSAKGTPLSDMTLSKVLRDAGQSFTVHGFRSSFRDWAAEKMPDMPDPVAEAALAHAVSDKIVAAYKRTDFIEMRRKLLDSWNEFLRTTSSVALKPNLKSSL